MIPIEPRVIHLAQVGEYISSLLTRAREISNEIFLKATAASFKEAWRMVDTIVQVASAKDPDFPKTKAEDVVYVLNPHGLSRS